MRPGKYFVFICTITAMGLSRRSGWASRLPRCLLQTVSASPNRQRIHHTALPAVDAAAQITGKPGQFRAAGFAVDLMSEA
jgi:hypothetical protein